MKKILLLTLISLTISSCSFSVRKNPVFDNAKLASVCIAQNDSSNVLIIRDYFPFLKNIDKVYSEALHIEPISCDGSYDTVNVAVKAGASALSMIEVTSGSEKGYIVFERRGENDGKEPFISSIGINGGGKEIIFRAQNTPANYIVLWQNTLLGSRFIHYKNEGTFTVTIPDNAFEEGRSYIRVFASNKNGIGNDVLIPLDKGAIVTDPSLLNRGDRHTQILYSLLIDRFYDGNPKNNWKIGNPKEVLPKVDYWGGDLAGVTQKLDEGYFDKLGVNTIWLSPITQNPYDSWGFNKNPKTKFSGYHGYWPIYVTKIDSRFGTDQELKTLLGDAHKRGDNVILDYVANHMHINSPTLKAHKDWTTPFYTPDGRENLELWDEFRLTTWFDKHIPSLDLEKEYISDPLTDSALFWMKNFDFDGFRHDATKHIAEIYWRKLTRKLLDSIPDKQLFQIGETYGSPELISRYVKTGILDGQFDFNIYDRFIEATIRPDGSFENLAKTIQESMDTYGYHNLMGNITGNHDRVRYVSYAGGDVSLDEDTKAAGWNRKIGVSNPVAYDMLGMLQTMIFTLPGNPCIYYGDEWGQPGANDPDNRRWAQFEAKNQNEQKVFDNASMLAHLRRSSMPLMYGDYYELFRSKDVLAYMRIYMGDYVIAILNKSNEAKKVEFTLPLSLVFEGDQKVTRIIEPHSYQLLDNK